MSTEINPIIKGFFLSQTASEGLRDLVRDELLLSPFPLDLGAALPLTVLAEHRRLDGVDFADRE
jgi:hypothetical protein